MLDLDVVCYLHELHEMMFVPKYTAKSLVDIRSSKQLAQSKYVNALTRLELDLLI